MMKIPFIVLSVLSFGTCVQGDDGTAPLIPPTDSRPLIEMQFSENPHAGKDPVEMVLSGQFLLTDVLMSPNENEILGFFCDFKFDQIGRDPSLAPRYIDYYGESVHCQEHSVSLPLREIAKKCRDHDGDRIVKPNAFLLHQPKSGSSLLTNMLTASSPDIHVFSEVVAIGEVIKCEKCDYDEKIQAVKDVVYLLGRNLSEGQLFLKISSQNTAGLPLLLDAFPDSKWLYQYRDPDIVLQKLMNLKHERRTCGRYRNNPGETMTKYLTSKDMISTDLESEEEACAAYLASHMSVVSDELDRDETMGKLVPYEDILSREGIEEIFDFLGVSTSNWDQIEDQRNKHANTGNGGEYKGDVLSITEEVLNAIKVHERAPFY